jgi:hypothetical protein
LQNKEPKSDVEVATFGKILGHFSPIVPPSAAGFASVATDAGNPLWRELERSKSLVLQVGGMTCRWQRHSVKTFCCECSTIIEQAKTQLRVVEPLEEEIYCKICRNLFTSPKFPGTHSMSYKLTAICCRINNFPAILTLSGISK